jgi:hypothetical protein
MRCEAEVAMILQSSAAAEVGERAAEVVKDHWQFKLVTMHLLSLMHGLALARLRLDYKLSNFEVRCVRWDMNCNKSRNRNTDLTSSLQSVLCLVLKCPQAQMHQCRLNVGRARLFLC